jgi:hypothetical protein
VPDDPRPPVAIRITRPYASEEEYLEQELELISRTGITLVGAHPRPAGVVLRFELVLSSGHVLVRGEGRVTGFKPNAHEDVGGLSLRFTRIDARSKALLDKATARREAKRPSSRPPEPTLPSSPPGEPVLPQQRSEEPPRGSGAAASVAAPPGRDALLGRLRSRAAALDPTAVKRILEARRVTSAR